MMGNDFARMVDDCLRRLDRGEDLPAVLADFPDHAERLKPLLLVAMASRAMDLPTADQTARRLGRNQMLAEMDHMGAADYYHKGVGYSRLQAWFLKLNNASRARSLVQPAPTYRLAIVALLMIFSVGVFTISVSASGFSGGMLSGLATDVRQVLGLGQAALEGGENTSFRPISFFSGEDLFLGGSRAAKVAFLLNLPDDEHTPDGKFSYQNQNQGSIQGSGSSAAEGGEGGGRENAPGQQDNPGLATAPGQQEVMEASNPPGIQDNPGVAIAPGLVDNPGIEHAPGLQKDKDKKDKDEKEKDEKDKDQEQDEGGEEQNEQ